MTMQPPFYAAARPVSLAARQDYPPIRTNRTASDMQMRGNSLCLDNFWMSIRFPA